ncbi:Coiled-coil domain-containing protein 94 [Chamberlinius hualienensis]
MSERKVLNKYYPPDFDPSKIPRLHLSKDRQYTVRLMAPCNMKCKTCGEYIYKGKKFNARKETVIGEEYLGLKIFRFYIKCTRCLAEITFKTDPQNADYIVEHGATRNFQALKLAEEQAEREETERLEEEAGNPMKLLESRTKASKQEMDVLEGLEELREMQERHSSIDHEQVINKHTNIEEILRLQEEEDEAFIRSAFGKDENNLIIKRISEEDAEQPVKPPSEPVEDFAPSASKKLKTWDKSVGSLSIKTGLLGVVKINSSKKETTNNEKAATRQKIKGEAAASTSKITETLKKNIDPLSSKADLSTKHEVETAAPKQEKSNGLGLISAYSDSDSN